MKRHLLILTLLSLSPLHGEDPEVNLEARKRSIAVIEERISERKERIAHLSSDLKSLNGRLEGQIDRIVKKLSSSSDSETSKTRVSHVKSRVMKGLARTIGRYQAKRNDLIREMRKETPRIPKETLESDAKIFDEQIAKRVSQVLELSKSFTQEKDVPKYETIKVDSYSGIGGLDRLDETQQITEEWRQNRRDRVMDHKQSREIVEALKKSLERHQNLQNSLENTLKSSSLPAADRKLRESELQRHRKIVAQRQDQLNEMSDVETPGTFPVSAEDAREMENALDDAADDLRRDFDQVFYKYAELNRERAKLAKISQNLAARKKWLSENGSK